MFLFVPFGATLLVGIIMLVLHFRRPEDSPKLRNKEGFGIWGVVNVIIGGVFVIIVVICTMVAHSTDRGADPAYAKIMEVRQIHEDKSKDLLKGFAAQVSLYAEHEKDVFTEISPEKVDFYWVKYPELRAIEAVKMNFVQIKELRTLIYDQDVKVAKLKQTVRFRRVNPWIITWFLGPVPEWAG